MFLCLYAVNQHRPFLSDHSCFRLQGDCDTSFGARFTFSIFSEELIVGEIFVRIYNDQPLFPLEVRIAIVLSSAHARFGLSIVLTNHKKDKPGVVVYPCFPRFAHVL